MLLGTMGLFPLRIARRASIHLGLLTGCLAGSLLIPVAWGQAPEALQRELDQLRQRVDAQEIELRHLRATWQRDHAQHQTDLRQAEALRTLVQEVLADASRRPSGLGDSPTAGYQPGRGFFLRDATGDPLLRVALNSQLRYLWNSRENAPPGQGEDVSGFQVHRIELDLQGHAFDPRWTYRLRLDVSNGGTPQVTWAWVAFQLDDAVNLRAGQLNAPFLREEIVGSFDQLTLERSYLADYFTTDFSQGLVLTFQRDRLRLQGALHNGSYGYRTDFDAERTAWALAARAEYLLVTEDPARGWQALRSHSAWSDQAPVVMLAAAADYEHGARLDGVRVPDLFKWTADLSAQWQGWSFFGAVIGQHFRTHGQEGLAGIPLGLQEANQFGVVAQLGTFVLPDQLELFGRYEWLDFDGAYYRNSGRQAQSVTGSMPSDSLHLLTLGGNYYLHPRSAKLSLELIYALDPVPMGSSGSSLLASERGEQFTLRSQVQIRF